MSDGGTSAIGALRVGGAGEPVVAQPPESMRIVNGCSGDAPGVATGVWVVMLSNASWWSRPSATGVTTLSVSGSGDTPGLRSIVIVNVPGAGTAMTARYARAWPPAARKVRKSLYGISRAARLWIAGPPSRRPAGSVRISVAGSGLPWAGSSTEP